MAPFRGNNQGTCSIEVLTLENTSKTWTPYIQDVLNRWMELKDNESNYTRLQTPLGERMDAIAEFRDIYGQIAKSQNWTVEDARERFNNDALNQLFFE
ncbi:hypothetical protein MGU_10911 [Metarhizium guizhouense ARSEF 977]|uniref:Uncharacterized protein n=1 Tax=Metarhizium guizhouense (strain ARSEF 977) TaxID=1276136 RepID=A0A0B4GGX4_METGA|nr:hypothetical protein MGU_10911 [Metarhizium guizhouense ARSEF 977]